MPRHILPRNTPARDLAHPRDRRRAHRSSPARQPIRRLGDPNAPPKDARKASRLLPHRQEIDERTLHRAAGVVSGRAAGRTGDGPGRGV